MSLMNSCPLSRKFWRELIVRLWMRYFKNGRSDCKMYWWKWWICWVMFKPKCSITFLNSRSWDATLRRNTLTIHDNSWEVTTKS
jgi:hypothetical protein